MADSPGASENRLKASFNRMKARESGSIVRVFAVAVPHRSA